MNPHEVLGVTHDATEEDIKKAYKKMAMEWHPDHHGGSKEAEEKFKEINMAYQILTGKARGPADQSGGPGISAEDLFNHVFRSGGFPFPFEDPFASFAHRTQTRPRLSLGVSLEDVCRGCRKPIRFVVRETCQVCTGAGREVSMDACLICGGTGRMSVTTSTSVFVISTPCQTCGGRGKKLGGVCAACHGSKTVDVRHETTVEIPRGVAEGEMLVAADGSHITVRYEPHTKLALVPGTLNTENEIEMGVLDMLLGGEAAVWTLAGEMRVKIDPGLRPGSLLRVRGAGLVGRRGDRGDHVVRVWARMPKLTEAHQKALRELRTQIEGEQK